MKTSLLFISLIFSQAAIASDFECQVTKVLDHGNFENENDFSFVDSPWVAFSKKTAEGRELIVGALSFTEQATVQRNFFEVDSDANKIVVKVNPDESGQIFSVFVDKKTKSGRLFYSGGGKPVLVAALSCVLK